MSTENIKLNEIWNTKSWKYHPGFRKCYNKYSFFLTSILGKTNKFEKRNPLMAMMNMDVTDFHWKKYFSASHDQFLRMIVIIVWFWIFHVWPSTIFISVSRSTTPIKTLPNHDKAGKNLQKYFRLTEQMVFILPGRAYMINYKFTPTGHC